MKTIQNPQEHWSSVAASVLLNRTIVAVRYLDREEADRLGWSSRSVIFELDNGDLVYPSRDDEGNDAGALFTTNSKADTLPVLSAF
jgi:hypothetical protein